VTMRHMGGSEELRGGYSSRIVSIGEREGRHASRTCRHSAMIGAHGQETHDHDNSRLTIESGQGTRRHQKPGRSH
jgi:hypothetical protein